MNSPTTFRSLRQATPPTISRLIRRARQLRQIASTVEKLLPPALADHCQPGNVENDTLTVYLDSSIWATKMRYFSPQLLAHLQGIPQTRHIRQIRTVVRPPLFQQPSAVTSPSRHRTLSSKSAALLCEAAAATESPRLSAALRRLARHVKK